MLFGFILGVLLTIAGAYAYDSNSGRAANGLSASAAGGQPPVVNWDVVNNDWRNLQAVVRAKAEDLQKRLKEHTG
jgi:hypothetical protein